MRIIEKFIGTYAIGKDGNYRFPNQRPGDCLDIVANDECYEREHGDTIDEYRYVEDHWIDDSNLPYSCLAEAADASPLEGEERYEVSSAGAKWMGDVEVWTDKFVCSGREFRTYAEVVDWLSKQYGVFEVTFVDKE